MSTENDSLLVSQQVRKLRAPFATDIHKFRPTKDGMSPPLTYVDSRHYMDRLDEVFGPNNWSSEFTPGNNGVICRLSFKWADGTICYKSDGAGETQVEGEKGQQTDAFKRACVMVGLGRYMYGLKMDPAPCKGYVYAPDVLKGLYKKLGERLAVLANGEQPPEDRQEPAGEQEATAATNAPVHALTPTAGHKANPASYLKACADYFNAQPGIKELEDAIGKMCKSTIYQAGLEKPEWLNRFKAVLKNKLEEISRYLEEKDAGDMWWETVDCLVKRIDNFGDLADEM